MCWLRVTRWRVTRWRVPCGIVVRKVAREHKSEAARDEGGLEQVQQHRVVRAAVSRRRAYLTLPSALADAFRLYREPFECRCALTAWRGDAARRRVHRTRADEYALQCALGRLQACCGRVRVRVRAHAC